MILKPTRVLENKSHILEFAGLLVDLRDEMEKKHPDTPEDVRKWALENAIMRLSIKDGHDFGEMI
jgi:hypothetical protein